MYAVTPLKITTIREATTHDKCVIELLDIRCAWSERITEWSLDDDPEDFHIKTDSEIHESARKWCRISEEGDCVFIRNNGYFDYYIIPTIL